MKMRRILALICVISMTVLFSACNKNSSDDGVIESVNTDETTTQEEDAEISEDKAAANQNVVEEKGTETEEKDVDKVSELVNPLNNSDTVYSGELKANDTETIKLIDCFIKTCPDGTPEYDKILSVTAADFDGNGTSEAFIFVGTGEDICYSGSIYYVDGKNTVNVLGTESDSEYKPSIELLLIDGYLDFGTKKYAYFDEYYATASLSYIYEVVDGKLVETNFSRCGCINVADDGTITITDSSYDATYDSEIGYYIGHTWKPYYFRFDEAKQQLVECSGKNVNIYTINDIIDGDIYNLIQNNGYSLINAYYRDNDILIVNMYKTDDYGINFYNVSYDNKNKKYINIWDRGLTDEFLEAIADGTYRFCISNAAQVAEPVVENLDFEVLSDNDIIELPDESKLVIGGVGEALRMICINSGSDVDIDKPGIYKVTLENSFLTGIQ